MTLLKTIFIWMILGISIPMVASHPNQTCTIFKIERSRNSEKVVYAINHYGNGKIDMQHPIKVYWEAGKEIKPLTFIQKKYSYGIILKECNSKEISFSIKALPEQEFLIKEIEDEGFKAFISINQKPSVVEKIFIQFKEGTTRSPDITYVEMVANCCENNEIITKRITP